MLETLNLGLRSFDYFYEVSRGDEEKEEENFSAS